MIYTLNNCTCPLCTRTFRAAYWDLFLDVIVDNTLAAAGKR